jgi:hypothetical protein
MTAFEWKPRKRQAGRQRWRDTEQASRMGRGRQGEIAVKTVQAPSTDGAIMETIRTLAAAEPLAAYAVAVLALAWAASYLAKQF